MLGGDVVQKVLLVIIILLCLNYVTVVLVGRLFKKPLNTQAAAIEGFASEESDKSLHVWLDNTHLYDKLIIIFVI